ncbi:MAG: hypothetical protein ACR2FE_02745 [Aeromicrobium sp.]
MIVRAYDLGVLKATEIGMPFYKSRGWEPWHGPLHAFTPDGITHQPDVEGSVLVFGVGKGHRSRRRSHLRLAERRSVVVNR